MISTNASTDILSNGIATQSTNPRLGSSELGQSDFLALMTAQLSAQDPLKPQDNGQFIAQMAQFSSVESLSRLESSFSELASLFCARFVLTKIPTILVIVITKIAETTNISSNVNPC